MHLEVLLEEPSAEAALESLLPKLLGEGITFRLHAHQGKPDLLKKLPGKLRGYSKWVGDDVRIVVLVDRDQDECEQFKTRLDAVSANAGIVSKTAAHGSLAYRLINRIAVEELEAWFFGDVEALCAAYPGVPATLGGKSAYRDPDAIRGGTWERLEQVLQKAGHFKGGLAKIAAAREISRHMDPARNRSRSFQVFRDGVVALVATGEQ